MLKKISIANRIRELRGKQSQKDFARAVGIGQSYLSQIESRRRKPSIATVKAIAIYCKVSTDFILTGEGPKTVKEGKQNSPKAGIDYSDIEQYDSTSEPNKNNEEVEMLKEVIEAHLRTIEAKDELIESLKRENELLRGKPTGSAQKKIV